uniref:Large ribosomal subunit protein bL12c n=1 Tax=Rhizochromulina marina TaxID=1034831 RepID=A0A514CPZ5_9STRA|nr:ribosomal protein L12 [Rhizochromulina marina]QDH81889.1 ribosomal protein L12 [Rhizochromulina marina]
MTTKIDEIMQQLQTLTLLEASELVEKIEQTFGVDASSGGGMMMMPGAPMSGAAAPVEEVEEKTEFDLLLAEVPADKKIAVLKVVRGITGLGLKEAKELVESAPKVIQATMAKEAAETAKKQLEEAGAKVELK